MNCQEAKGALDLTKNLSKTYQQKKRIAKKNLEYAKALKVPNIEEMYQKEINEITHEQKINTQLRNKAKRKLNSGECKV